MRPFIGRRLPPLVSRYIQDLEDEATMDEEQYTRAPARRSPIAFVVDDRVESKIGEGFQALSQGAKFYPGFDMAAATTLEAQDFLLDVAWLARVVFIMGPRVEQMARRARTSAATKGRSLGRLLCGPVTPTTPVGEVDAYADFADGLIYEPDTTDDVDLDAETLRRALAWCRQAALERGGWTRTPFLAVHAPLDVLSRIPPGVADFRLMRLAPPDVFKLHDGDVISVDQESEPAWAGKSFAGIGPDVVCWRRWMDDPRGA